MHHWQRAVWSVAIVVLFLITIQLDARSEDSSSPIKIRVDSILARYKEPYWISAEHRRKVHMDPKLVADGIAERLQMMFDYDNYSLVRHQVENAACGDAVAFNLPGGHILHVAPMEIRADTLSMDLAMFEGARLIMRAPFRAMGGGLLMLVDQHEPNQFFITAISVDSPRLERARAERKHLGPSAPIQIYPALVPAQ